MNGELKIMIRKHINKRNPILPLDIFIPDSEAHVMPDGNLYIYGSFDDREDVYCSEKYHVISTKDMNEWVIHDISLKGQSIPWFFDPKAPKYPGIDWNNPTNFVKKMLQQSDQVKDKEKFEKLSKGKQPPLLFAPDACFKNGKYYLYFCMSDDSEGVAISDSPYGPFENPIQLPCGGIDPAIFIDDDGKAYYYWGQLFSHGVQLNDDMISFNKENIVHNLVTEEEHYFHEGSSMRKINGTYYYVFTNIENGKPTSLGYATGPTPLGPFTYRGIIINNETCDSASWNNHGSIECFNNEWYVFYHRCSRGVPQHRRLCIERIYINDDGSIDEVLMTSQGIGEPFQPGETIMGYQACELKGNIQINCDKQYVEKLCNINDSDEALFRYVKNDNQWNDITILYKGVGRIYIYFDDELAGICECNSLEYISQSFKIYMKPGKYTLKFKFEETMDLEIISLILR